MGAGRTAVVTGATGYIGGRLVPALLASGWRVRCLVRGGASRLRDHPWSGEVEIIDGDAGDVRQLTKALTGAALAYYLIHSLRSDAFESKDRDTAQAFAQAARAAGVGRLVYLGGLAPEDEELSPHLRSRAEVAEILLRSGVPTVVLRAGVIIGSGSVSFEMLRYLSERLPAMITPRWVHSRIQPIAIRDVVRYLVACAELPPEVNRGFDIGGPDVLTYVEMMKRYAAIAELPRRVVISTPLLTPRLSSLWVGLITPVPSALARPLVESLINNVVCREHDIGRFVPDPTGGLIGFDAGVELALKRIRDAQVVSRWSSAATPGAPSDPLPTDPDWAGGSLYTDVRERDVDAESSILWRVIEGIGGARGWYSFPLAWEIRGLLDRAVGGVGLRRGRRDPDSLFVGESLDFWRVEERVPGRQLRLRAEMRLPGLAWLEFNVHERDGHGSRYEQRAIFHPRGLLGHAYWWAVAPFHGFVFGGMCRNIAVTAEKHQRELAENRPDHLRIVRGR